MTVKVLRIYQPVSIYFFSEWIFFSEHTFCYNGFPDSFFGLHPVFNDFRPLYNYFFPFRCLVCYSGIRFPAISGFDPLPVCSLMDDNCISRFCNIRCLLNEQHGKLSASITLPASVFCYMNRSCHNYSFSILWILFNYIVVISRLKILWRCIFL